MPSRRFWLRLISCLVLLLALLGAYGYLSLSRLLEREQIDKLEWQGLGISTQGIQLDQLSLQYPGGALQLQQVQLGWHGFSLILPLWQRIQITRLQLSLPSSQGPTPSDSMDIDGQLEQLAAVINLLPQRLQIAALQVELPCADTRCQLSGDLLLHKNHTADAQQLDVLLNLQHQQDQLRWHALLQGDAASAELQLNLAINQQPQLRLNSRLQTNTAGRLWRGDIAGDLQHSAMLHSWLSQWLPITSSNLPEAPKTAELRAS
jgi:hypothetical protein